MLEEFKDKIIIQRKRVKNINIRIRDEKVLVSAPYNAGEDLIYSILKEKEIWIKERLKVKKEITIKELLSKEIIDEDEKIPFLGKEYKVCIREKSNGGVVIKEDKIIINCYRKENAMEILKRFYIEAINRELIKALNKMEAKTGLKANRVTLKFMKTRWGSCNKVKKYINLNGELIAKKCEAIEYVALHELCHLVQGNHSKEFYKLVEAYMEDYKIQENYLNKK